MARIICITGMFDVYNEGVKTGRKELLVSHGVDESTGKAIVLPCEHPSKLGAVMDSELKEWVIPSGKDMPPQQDWQTNQRNKMMADKLFEQLQNGHIEADDWTETFINDMHQKTKAGRTLTEKQQAKLEQLFERY